MSLLSSDRLFPCACRVQALVLGCLLTIATAIGCADESSGGAAATDSVGNATEPESEATLAAEDLPESTPEENASDPEVPEKPWANRGSAVDAEDRVLRHAVFFGFKDESTEDDIRSVVDAFAALPAAIPEIIDFEWGVNNSPENLDAGFTHCFLLTFSDEAGRAAYLPHEQHKAFGDVLRPHMKQVFVIDYWGNPADDEPEGLLRHAVFFRFQDGASEESVAAVEQAFADLEQKIEAVRRIEWGTNNSPEKHDAGFTHCFLVTFDSEDARAEYLPHPDHQAFVEVLKPVLEEVRVLDWVAQSPK